MRNLLRLLAASLPALLAITLVAPALAADTKSIDRDSADVYAFFFDQKGLMAGMGLQGTKIYPIER
jgi:lipid-binding SYLF domain-containing protein